MAFSKSIQQAQDIKLCELCEENSIKWRCVDCERCLCEKCKTIHLRVPATAQHQIVTIGTPLGNIQRKIITDNIICSKHSEKMAALFCKSCDSMICLDCVTSSHKPHNFIQIELAIEEKLDYARKVQDQIGNNLKTCNIKTSEVQDMEMKCNAIFDESLTKIKQKEQELIEAIKKQSKLLQDEVDLNRRQIICILSKIKQDIDNTKKNLQKQRDETGTILTSNQGKVILGTTIMIADLKFDSLPIQPEQFVPDKDSAKKILQLFGSLQKQIIHPPEMKLEVVATYTTNLPFVNKVLILDEESAWISNFGYNICRKIQIKDNTMTTCQELSLCVYDMAITSNGDILLTNKSEVKLLKQSGDIVSFMSVAPLLPLGIHVTKDNDVIVGVIEDYSYTLTDQSQRAIVVYGMDGKQKHQYQYDKDGNGLFKYPKRVTTNYNQDIIVIDKQPFGIGRLVVLNKNGELRWVYEGSDKINANEQFDPRDVVTTTAGLIIVSDYGTQTAHILSENGEVLFCKDLKDFGIMWPCALAIDKSGRLWIGCDTGGQPTEAEINILNLTN